MGGTSRAFSQQGALDLATVAAALRPRFTLATGPRQTASHTWLDTFDWRLHSAGMSLRHSDAGQLILQLADGSRVQTPLAGLAWPALAHELPVGPIREVLTPLIAPRALVPVVTVQASTQESRILDAEEKTVARLLIEGADDGATQLRVVPLRGYDAAGRRIARLLANVDGFSTASTAPYDLALAHAERIPVNGESSATLMRRDSSATATIAHILAGFAAVIEENVPGAVAAVDVEFLHDLRVAVRRTRSILKLVGDVLPDQLAARFAAEFKWLGDLTTPVRDLDVYLLELDDMAARLTTAEPGDLEPFRSLLTRHRAAERRRLVRGLRSKRFHTLLADWRDALDQLATDADGGPTVAALARRRLTRAYRDAARCGRHIDESSPGDDVHALRKRCKELRYLLEVFKPVCAVAPHRALLKELKSLQDTLGDFQDGEVQRETVREFAAAMMSQGAPPATLLAMGEMAAQLDAHQLRARAALAGRLRPFLADENRSRVKALVRP